MYISSFDKQRMFDETRPGSNLLLTCGLLDILALFLHGCFLLVYSVSGWLTNFLFFFSRDIVGRGLPPFWYMPVILLFASMILSFVATSLCRTQNSVGLLYATLLVRLAAMVLIVVLFWGVTASDMVFSLVVPTAATGINIWAGVKLQQVYDLYIRK